MGKDVLDAWMKEVMEKNKCQDEEESSMQDTICLATRELWLTDSAQSLAKLCLSLPLMCM